MGRIECGKTSNLIVSYKEGDDDELSFGWNIQLAQTFTLHAQYCICRAFLLMKPMLGTSDTIFYLYNTDGAGKPTGAPISTTTKHFEEPHAPVPHNWQKFVFTDFPILAAGTYALVIACPKPACLLQPEWRRDETPPVYLEGKAWRSLDFGNTWLPEADCTLMFEVYGYQPPPNPPPVPVTDNWAPISFSKILLDDGFLIIFETDKPCHLWLRWTNVEPQKHLDPVFRRGLAMHSDPRFCFVAWRENEQDEAGDTLTHSWYKRGWQDGEERWFYFIGTRLGQTSPSVSPIFYLNFGYKLAESLPFDLHHVRVNKDFIQYAAFRPTLDGYPDHLHLKFGREGEPGDLTLSLHYLKDDGYPNPQVIASETVAITGMPEIPFAKYFTFQFSAGRLNPDIWYALRAYCPSVFPIEVRWFGYPNVNDPNSYWIQYRADIDRWYFIYPTRLNYLIRGRLRI